MYQVIRKQTRPSKDVRFAAPPDHPVFNPDVLTYIAENFTKSGRLVYIDRQIGSNQLEMTVTQLWQTEQDLRDFQQDPFIKTDFIDPIQGYNQEFGINDEVLFEGLV